MTDMTLEQVREGVLAMHNARTLQLMAYYGDPENGVGESFLITIPPGLEQP